MSNNIVNISSLTVSYGSNNVLRGVSFGLTFGERLLLSGRSGSGKSTLLHAIAGLVPEAHGEIIVSDISVIGQSDHALSLLRRQIGFAFQQASLYPELSVKENVAWVGRLRGLSRRSANSAAMDVLALLGISHLAGAVANTVSGGEAQRANVARSLVGGTRLLLVDEPTAALDVSNSHLVCQALERATAELETSAIIASHDPIVRDYVDRISVMDDGLLR